MTTYPRSIQFTFENPKKNIPAIVKRYVYLKRKAKMRTKFEGSAMDLDFE